MITMGPVLLFCIPALYLLYNFHEYCWLKFGIQWHSHIQFGLAVAVLRGAKLLWLGAQTVGDESPPAVSGGRENYCDLLCPWRIVSRCVTEKSEKCHY
jgi:hypothetical protein